MKKRNYEFTLSIYDATRDINDFNLVRKFEEAIKKLLIDEESVGIGFNTSELCEVKEGRIQEMNKAWMKKQKQ